MSYEDTYYRYRYILIGPKTKLFEQGLGANIISAALLDIVELTNSSVEELSQWSFVIASLSYCSSAILGGYFGRNMSRHLFCTISVILSGLSRVAVPASRSVIHYSLAMVLTGVSNAGIDVGVNSWLLDMWHGDQSNMYMQILHFSYAAGSLASPFIAEPFLSSVKNETILIFNSSLDENVTDFKITKYETGIIYPYSLCAILQLSGGAMLMFLYFYLSSSKNQQNTSSDTDEWEPIMEEEASEYSPKMKVKIIVTAGIVLAVETGMETNIFSYIQAFVVGDHYSKSKGAFVLSALTASFTGSRGLSALAALKIPIKYILIFSLATISLSTAILQFLLHTGEVYLWIGFCAMGAGLGPFYAGLFSLVEKDIRVTTKICGIFVFMSSIASIICDLTTGKFIQSYLIIYPVYNWSSLLLLIPTFILLILLLSKKSPKPKTDANSNILD